MGGLLTLPSFLKVFPQIDTVNPPEGITANEASNYQGMLSRARPLPPPHDSNRPL